MEVYICGSVKFVDEFVWICGIGGCVCVDVWNRWGCLCGSVE